MSRTLVTTKTLAKFMFGGVAAAFIVYFILTSSLSTPLAASLIAIFLFTICAVSLGTRSGIAPADVENTEQISDPIFVNDTILVNDTWILKH